uniref:Major sperm protein n=1 Tax=Heterorhabditis bacteriophora TaxID=37862 RepID=A0A1I7X5N0_HETBA
MSESQVNHHDKNSADSISGPNGEIPPFLNLPAVSRPLLRFMITVNPQILVFDNTIDSQSAKAIQITNASDERITWRVLSNAPTRYVVVPNKGFLTCQETVTVNVILVNGTRYHHKHAFLVQAKTAKVEENNRKASIHIYIYIYI